MRKVGKTYFILINEKMKKYECTLTATFS